MKDIFPGFHSKSKQEIDALWANGHLFFDTNVLLNLYRYSDQTREAILDLISKFKDEKRIWLPHQTALEYNRNRYEVISAQEKEYNTFKNDINKIQEDLKSTSKPPFLSKELHKSLNDIFKKVQEEVQSSLELYASYFNEDPIYDKLTEIFKNRITKAYSEEELEKIKKEGILRYEKNIPPGYADTKNKNDDKKFGDLILWKQIIQKSSELQKPVILITDEKKEDWWWKIKNGKTIGPRQELIEEIYRESKAEFHMYSSEKFIVYSQEHLKQRVNQKAINEIKEIQQSRMREYLHSLKSKKETEESIDELDVSSLIKLRESTKFHIDRLQSEIDNFTLEPEEKIEESSEFINLRRKLLKYRAELIHLNLMMKKKGIYKY